jgi:GntR family transcriptional regulator, rspAB operon transcriptional repressor
MAARSTEKTQGTLAERAYRVIKQGILRGELPEGSFLVESEILARHALGRTPFREACNRLHNEELLEVVPRRGYFVPEPSFRAVRDLLEARLVLEGVAAELAAMRGEPREQDTLETCHRKAVKAAKNDLDAFIGANQEFHLQIARMTHNRELETILTRLLERSTRLVYLAAGSAKAIPREVDTSLKAIVDAIRKRDAAAAQKAVVADITRGQLHVLGADLWTAK